MTPVEIRSLRRTLAAACRFAAAGRRKVPGDWSETLAILECAEADLHQALAHVQAEVEVEEHKAEAEHYGAAYDTGGRGF